jgi:nucleoid-associated protein YgaU
MAQSAGAPARPAESAGAPVRPTGAARVAVALAIAAMVAPGVAQAQDALRPVTYRVKQGDTLELIAAEFYGDRNKALFIAAENKLTRPRPLRPGERLRIPVSREITTAPGDTFESLAMTYLGSARRGGFLADWSGIPQDESLPAGTSITIPFAITYTAQTPETLAEVARSYLGDSRQSELLRRYNQLEKATLDRGEAVIVPAFQVRLNPARQPALDAESKARRDHRRDASAQAARALPAARLAWKDGDFAQVKAVVMPLEPDLDYLDADQAVELAVLLGGAHVAYDAEDLALACFKRALDRHAQHALRRYDISPKILAVWQKAGGPVE